MKAKPPTFFASAASFRQWLARHHAGATELWVGFYKKDSGKGGITYPEALDEALCYGWIDGIRKRVNATSYTIRFTPRKATSNWSAVNVRHATRLIETRRMRSPGLAAFEAREGDKAGYSHEERPARLAPALAKRFRAAHAAWAFFQAQPPGYRRTATFWVMSAKRDETRERRLTSLIACSAKGQRIPLLAPPS
ncbi:MAG: YdeI/OmpD-associated family protein [Gemmatimonadota bacterium]|nr:YdeI/OmpD-associated family protein [Gemmatimonadota bacterium]MDH4351602.1 YdeI/OmpD-associated family protein [Gemmatimonadota bacterium]MDH5197797.1 YdeI/OmpD-associated family protein [Gemmatimonadota bacterium]